MQILTDGECVTLARAAARGSATTRDGSASLRVARAIEAAVLASLAEGQEEIGEVRDDYDGHPWKRIACTSPNELAQLPVGHKVYPHPSAEVAALREEVERLSAHIQCLLKDQESYGPDKVAIQKQAWVEADRQRQVHELHAQLAAAQAENQRLREGCQRAIDVFEGTQVDRAPIYYALAGMRDTSALDEIKAGYEAREQQLREALEDCIEWLQQDHTGHKHSFDSAKEALALPNDHSALDAYLAPYKQDAERLKAAFHRHRKACHLHALVQPSWAEWVFELDTAIAAGKEKKGGDAC